MKFNSVINNGVEIPNQCKCIWCGGEMERRGANYMGSGVNSFTMWCNNCGAIAHHARDFSRKISDFEIKYGFDK